MNTIHKITAGLVVAAAITSGAQSFAPNRAAVITGEVTYAQLTAPGLAFAQGDAFRLQVVLTDSLRPYSIPTNAALYWIITAATNSTPVYMITTGTVVSATNRVQFDAWSSQTRFQAGKYRGRLIISGNVAPSATNGFEACAQTIQVAPGIISPAEVTGPILTQHALQSDFVDASNRLAALEAGAGITSLPWEVIANIPSGFADGVDDVGVSSAQMNSAIASEAALRTAGDALLTSNISSAVAAEASARSTADAALTTNVSGRAYISHTHTGSDIVDGSLGSGDLSSAAVTLFTNAVNWSSVAGTGVISVITSCSTDAFGTVFCTNYISGPGLSNSSSASATNQVQPSFAGNIGGVWTINFDAGSVQRANITSAVTSVLLSGLDTGFVSDVELFIANPSLYSIAWPTSNWFWVTGLAPALTTNGWDLIALTSYSNVTRAARYGGSAQ